jgi:beta-lactam-binding protein with PASTA domain
VTTSIPTSVVNNTSTDATLELCAAGLRPLYVKVPAVDRGGGNINGYAVKALSPVAGSTVKSGSTVDVTLAVSVPTYIPLPGLVNGKVPDLVGRDINAATLALTTYGLGVHLIPTTPTGSLAVTSESPPPGTIVHGGQTVTLRFGRVGSQGCPQ